MIPTAVLLACSTITAVCKTTTTGFEKGKEGEEAHGFRGGGKETARNEEKGSSVYRGTGNRCLVEAGVGRGGFGLHGDKQPPGPTELVAGVGRKGWPRASVGQVRPGV